MVVQTGKTRALAEIDVQDGIPDIKVYVPATSLAFEERLVMISAVACKKR